MRTRPIAMLALLGVLALAGCTQGGRPFVAEPETAELTILRPGGVSPGPIDSMWQTRTTALGAAPTWTGELDSTAPSKAPVFIMRPRAAGNALSTAVTGAVTARDVTLSVSLKVESGSDASGGGLVWRYRDDRNCYFCAFGPRSGDFALYVTRDGVPRRLASTHTTLDPAAWHTLVVKHAGNRIICTLDEDTMIGADDDSLPSPGAVGLWAAGDSATRFTSIRATTRR